ncbi:MAG: 7-carboxy-7-deazaguanine synthase QueE [Bacillota bacterium]|nr:7-carboxy-7-deazaguanine synthase QueE [Bacillota bacterium]
MILLETSFNLIEMFSSVQGEGPFIGFRQIFIRFSRCNLNCIYCDTPNNQNNLFCVIEQNPGYKDFKKEPNPISMDKIIDSIRAWNPKIHHSVSFTGGEPLLEDPLSLVKLMKEIKSLQLKVFLETNGTLPERFQELAEAVDIVSMDIKLPSSVEKDYTNEHYNFIKAAQKKELYLKIVITKATMIDELQKYIELIASVNRDIPLILQPATQHNDAYPPSSDKLLYFQEIAQGILNSVRIIPQAHKMMNQL